MTPRAWSLLVGSFSALCLQGCSWSFFGEDSQSRPAEHVSSTVRTTTTTTTSVFTCPEDPDLPVPSSPEEHRGQSWKTECIDKEEGHFFGIGDWGGEQAGQVWWNAKAPRGAAGPSGPADEQAANFIGRQMKTLADKVKPDYVLNAGDNFYPGGYRQDCMVNWNGEDPQGQFKEVFGSNESSFNGVSPVYGKGVGDIPWLSVLGNHDYGGFKYNSGWDAQVYHSWSGADNWRLPAQYWHQHVKYRGFSVDFYMLDSNYPDAVFDGGSGMCDSKGGHWDCWALAGDNCGGYFTSLWHDGLAWLEQKLQSQQNSTADSEGPNWRILLTHFPVDAWGRDAKIQELQEKYGFHLIFTGHRHQQEFHFGGPANLPVNYIVSGGGGGITSETYPSQDGRDLQYGFVDFKINAEDLTVEFHSWGGEKGLFREPLLSKKILQSQPRKKAEDTGRGVMDDPNDHSFASV